MPELAEVEFYRKQWMPAKGQRVAEVLVHPKARVFREVESDILVRELPGSRFMAGESHGKQLCFRFSGNRYLGIHLGMAGHLGTAAPEMVPAKHDHLVLRMGDTVLVFSDYRMFGKVRFHKGDKAHGDPRPDWWRALPPEPHSEAFDRRHLNGILKRRGRAPLKALLLDQDAFPGIGNWMADEILWRARIHPAASATSLSGYKRGRLFQFLKEVCKDALDVIGTDWGTPPDEWLFNHRWREGGTCPVSGKPLERITVGGRTTCFSPATQKFPNN